MKPRQKAGLIAFVISSITVLVLIALTLGVSIRLTSTDRFCISCHEMADTVYLEYQNSIHSLSPAGADVQCGDCHVPRQTGQLLVSKIKATKDLYYSFIGTIDSPEKFEQQRLRLANNVWKKFEKNDSQACRHCHQHSPEELSSQDTIVKKKHLRAKAENKTCISCHRGIAHELPESML